MKEHTMLQVFAVNKGGEICFVEDVARGMACECYCPDCKESVVARQGEIRGWHFAHASGSECIGSGETALHLAAKQIIINEKGIMVPEVSVAVEHKLPDGRLGLGTVTRPEMWIDFLKVDTEINFGEIRPDVVAYLNDGLMFIEIAVTHYIDEQKAAAINNLSVPTLEIDLSELINTRLDWESLKALLIDALYNKIWISPLGQTLLEAEAMQLAINDALSKNIQTQNLGNRKKPVKYKYSINSKTVYLTEHSYSVRVWIQPVMSVVNVVKPILKDLGGSYKKYTNDWWFPPEAKADLHEELLAISSKAPEILNE
jgi:competence protein CoiA